MTTLAVVMASYCRKATTLRCLRNLAAAPLPPELALDIYIVDDASPDGTANAVKAEFPGVHLLEGNGSLYWGGGMRLAFGKAMERGYDFYLWLNDDVTLRADAFAGLLATYATVAGRGAPDAIVVGATADAASGLVTYGGRRRNSWNPLRFALVEPDARTPVRCETMNGNIVLISRGAAARLGNIDPEFTQQMGDFDYGLRAGKAGIPVYLSPTVAGACAPNDRPLRWKSRELSFAERRRLINTPLGLPFREWMTFCWRWGGALGVAAGLYGYRGLFFSGNREYTTRLGAH